MKPISSNERLVANIFRDEFQMLPDTHGADIGQSVLQLNDEQDPGVGFHAY